MPQPETQLARSRKRVTAVFCDLVGSTELGDRFDAETLREILGVYFRGMRAAIEAHGGSVEKFIGDAVVGIFGLPRAHEDDAIRAVEAAQAMLDQLQALNRTRLGSLGVSLQVRIGVNSGEVVTANPESTLDFVAGDPLNVAARLQQAAPPGGVLIGRLTFELTAGNVEATPVEPIEAKGKLAPVNAYRLDRLVASEQRASAWAETPFVGRDRELHILLEALESHRAGHAGSVLVVGPPGIGKTRLVREFLRHTGLRALQWRCRMPREGSTVTQLPVPDHAEFDAVILDDLQWASAVELEMLRRLFGDGQDSPPFGILVGRTEATGHGLLDMLEARPARLELRPLHSADAESLIREMAPDSVAQHAARLAAASDGNPLYAREYARHAAVEPERALEQDVPAPIRAIVEARIDELMPHERTTLECAAVIGAQFRRPALLALAERYVSSMADQSVGSLLERQLIKAADSDMADLLAFDTPLIAETVYASILREARARYHETYARMIDSSDRRLIATHLVLAAEAAPVHSSRARRADLAREAVGLLEDVAQGGEETQDSSMKSFAERAEAILAGHLETREIGDPLGSGDRRKAARLEWRGPDGRELEFDLDPSRSPVLLGRSSACDVQLAGDEEISRSHAELVHRDRAWWLRDLGSRNGSSVDGRRASRPTQLRDGAELALGETRIRFFA